MNKEERISKAKETLDIIKAGRYISRYGQRIDVQSEIASSVTSSILYRENEFDNVLADAERKIKVLDYNTNIQVENISVLKSASALTSRKYKTGCLNFASAKNPGGGFLNGAQAQEESLALSSILYATQMKNFELYEHNHLRHSYLYSDHMIYSPDVVVFRNDEGDLLENPYLLSIITSPAVNIAAMKINKPEEMREAEATMLGRVNKILALFVHYGIRHLILGAWGCGVFQNKPEDIAALFARYLNPAGKYGRCFEQVCFAVYDKSKNLENISAFRKQFN
jgi:uncharacterized protein (TIGR02452 family)